MQNEFEKHSSTYECQLEEESKKKYVKLTPEIKQLFLRKIVFDNLSIKEASEMLRINYSSAKTIASAHKKEKIGKSRRGINRRTAKVCGYRSIEEEGEEAGVKEILSSVGGLVISTNFLPKRKLISKIISNGHELRMGMGNVELLQGF